MTLSPDRAEAFGDCALRVLELTGKAVVDDSWRDTEFLRIDFLGEHVVYGSCFVLVDDDRSGAETVVTALDALTNDLSEVDGYWGVAFPRCPGHQHPSAYAAHGAEVVLTCPSSGVAVSRTAVPT